MKKNKEKTKKHEELEGDIKKLSKKDLKKLKGGLSCNLKVSRLNPATTWYCTTAGQIDSF